MHIADKQDFDNYVPIENEKKKKLFASVNAKSKTVHLIFIRACVM